MHNKNSVVLFEACIQINEFSRSILKEYLQNFYHVFKEHSMMLLKSGLFILESGQGCWWSRYEKPKYCNEASTPLKTILKTFIHGFS